MEADTLDEVINIAIQIGGQGAKVLGFFLAILFLGKILEGVKALNDFVSKGRGGLSKGAGNFGKDFAERADNRRAARAVDGRGISNITSLGRYRRRASRDAQNASLKAERSRAEQKYVAGKVATENDDGELVATRFGRKLAGGSLAGRADPQAVQRALAAAKFTIEKVEADEVKAQHALLENFSPDQLMDVINNPGANDPAKVAAAIEKIVKVGTTEQIGQAIDAHGSSGKSSVITRSLGSALAADGPGFLKGSDIGKISQGVLGATTADVAAKNVAAGAYSQEKMVAAAPDELKYASDAAAAVAAKTGDMSAVDKLKETADLLEHNAQLVGKIKHNAENIHKLAQYGTI
jgi:hypothetical protein